MPWQPSPSSVVRTFVNVEVSVLGYLFLLLVVRVLSGQNGGVNSVHDVAYAVLERNDAISIIKNEK
jgi:hypothetical protein